MALRCNLCQSIQISEAALIKHLHVSHQIQRAKAFWDQVKLYQCTSNNIINTSLHWRCLKFVCSKCPFETHLKSVMLIHRRKKNHVFLPLKTKLMKVVLPRYETFNPQFRPGQLVNAKIQGFPYWPGIIFADAASGKYYKDASGGQSYYVKFFDTYSTTKCWVPKRAVKSYCESELSISAKHVQAKKTKLRLVKSIEWAEYVVDMSESERLDYFKD